MKTFIISILALLLTVASNQSYTGKWVYFNEEYGQDLVLDLIQKDSSVTGKHSAVMLNGNRIDDSGEAISIRGTIENNKLIVKLKSGYGDGEPGTAKISFVGQDSIYFEFITPPSGEYWIPNKVTLTRKK